MQSGRLNQEKGDGARSVARIGEIEIQGGKTKWHREYKTRTSTQ
jgi:hypothetical protein